MKRILSAAFGWAVLLPVAASAQIYNGVPGPQEYLDFVGGSGVGSSYGVQVGPYVGHFQGDPASVQFSLFCVDYNHYAKSHTVNVTGIGSGDLSLTRADDFGLYQRAAYLASLFETAPTTSWGAIHAAIWYDMSGVSLGNQTTRAYYTSLADANAASFDTQGWYVLSPLDVTGTTRTDGTGQEFLMRTSSVPEPALFLLLASGILLLGALSRRRIAASPREARVHG